LRILSKDYKHIIEVTKDLVKNNISVVLYLYVGQTRERGKFPKIDIEIFNINLFKEFYKMDEGASGRRPHFGVII